GRRGPGMLVDRVPVLAVDAAVDGMNDAVAVAAAGVLEERGRENALAARREDDIDRIIHAAGHDRFDAAAVGPGAEDVGGAGDEWLPPHPALSPEGRG